MNAAQGNLTTARQWFGLATMRAESGVTLEQIRERTKISMRFLEAIEAEEFERLPGGIYTLNYIQQYAAAIGYDPAPLVEYCRQIIGDDMPETQPAPEQASRGVIEWLRLLGSLQRNPTTGR